MSQLIGIDLWGNQLSGSIPPELGNLTNLQFLVLGANQLSGSIPPELGNLTLLKVLHLNNNQLKGNLPTNLSTLINLYNVGEYNGYDGLDLDYNYLNIPTDYPDPGDPFHLFLNQKDPNWHLRQGGYIYLPILMC